MESNEFNPWSFAKQQRDSSGFDNSSIEELVEFVDSIITRCYKGGIPSYVLMEVIGSFATSCFFQSHQKNIEKDFSSCASVVFIYFLHKKEKLLLVGLSNVESHNRKVANYVSSLTNIISHNNLEVPYLKLHNEEILDKLENLLPSGILKHKI